MTDSSPNGRVAHLSDLYRVEQQVTKRVDALAEVQAEDHDTISEIRGMARLVAGLGFVNLVAMAGLILAVLAR